MKIIHYFSKLFTGVLNDQESVQVEGVALRVGEARVRPWNVMPIAERLGREMARVTHQSGESASSASAFECLQPHGAVAVSKLSAPPLSQYFSRYPCKMKMEFAFSKKQFPCVLPDIFAK